MTDIANLAYGKPYSDGSGYEWSVSFTRGLGGNPDVISVEVHGSKLSFDPLLLDPAILAEALSEVRRRAFPNGANRG